MDQICKFLSVDFCDVVLDLFHCENENESQTSSNRRHSYPKRLVTYDAEEIGEPRLIRMSDLTESVMDLMMPNCKRRKTQDEDECEEDEDECGENEDECQAANQVKAEVNSTIHEKYNDECKQMNVEVGEDECEEKEKEETNQAACNFLKSFFPGENFNEERLKQLEQCSKILYERFLQRQTEEGIEVSSVKIKWESLKPMQKFCFYWQTLTGHVLHATPFENFKDIFIRRYRRKCPRGRERDLRGVVRRCWRCLKSEERVPFNLNALLYHVSTGKVDPFNHGAVRMLLNRWR